MSEIKLKKGEKLTLKSLLKSRNISVEQLADDIGVTPGTVYAWIDGKPIKSPNLIKACANLQIPFDLFLLAMGYPEEEVNKVPKHFQKAITYIVEEKNE